MITRILLWILLIAGLAGTWWEIEAWRKQPPEVRFTRVTRETITNSVPTNGKVEPIEWAEARAERSGSVQEMLVQHGQQVAKDTPLVKIDASDAHAELAAAQARITQIRADLEVIERGGRATDLTEISSGLERAHFDLQTAQKEYDALVRLQARQAATSIEVTNAKERVDRAQLQIRSLEERRASLVAGPERGA